MIRMAVIDCGDVIDRYASVAPRLRNAAFTAVVLPEPEKALLAARRMDTTASATSAEALLAEHSGEFDAVLIHSTPHLRAEHAKRAAAAGKHVLVETPLATTTAEADSVVEACRAAGVRLMVGPPLRFLPSVRTIMACLEEGKLGDPGLLRVHRWEPLGSGAHLRSGSGQQGQAAEQSGTAFASQPFDEIDLACWVFGRLPTAVYSVGGRPLPSQIEGFDYMQLHLGFPGGGMALIDYARTLPVGDCYYSLSVIGSTGAVYADDHHNMQLAYRGGSASAMKTGQGHAHLQAQLGEFVAAIIEQREPAITGADGRAAVQVAEAAAQSISTGRAARLAGGSYELA
jgi:predicted dehydrogenase